MQVCTSLQTDNHDSTQPLRDCTKIKIGEKNQPSQWPGKNEFFVKIEGLSRFT